MTAPTPDTAEERAHEIEIVFKGKITSNVDFEATYANIAAALRAAEAGARRAAIAECARWMAPNFPGQARDMVRALAASSPAAASPWREIASAPKDVREEEFILLWFPHDKSRWLAKWQNGWYGVDEYGLTRDAKREDCEPTGWMPLPSPPASEGTT